MLYEWVINVLQQFSNIRDVTFQLNLFSPTLKRRIIEKTYCQSVDMTPASTYFDKCNSVIFQHEIKKNTVINMLDFDVLLVSYKYLPSIHLSWHGIRVQPFQIVTWFKRICISKIRKNHSHLAPCFQSSFVFSLFYLRRGWKGTKPKVQQRDLRGWNKHFVP